MTAGNQNRRETGARKLQGYEQEVDRDKVGLPAAKNRRSGLQQPAEETVTRTRQSDAVDQGAAPDVPGSRKRTGKRA